MQELVCSKEDDFKNLSDACAKRFYKQKQRNSKIVQAELETEIKRRPSAFKTEEEIQAIQSKDNLTLKEAAVLLNISPLTLRRRILAGKVDSKKGWKEALDFEIKFECSEVIQFGGISKNFYIGFCK